MKKLLGKGTFSRVYDNEDGTVEIISSDHSKECLAIFCQGVKHLPQTEITEDGTYIQEKYERISSVKNIPDWKGLKKIEKAYFNLERKDRHYNNLIDILEKYKTEISEGVYQALTTLLENFSNYAYFIGFEIARRNLAFNSLGELILLDVVFCPDQLDQIRTSQRAKRMPF